MKNLESKLKNVVEKNPCSSQQMKRLSREEIEESAGMYGLVGGVGAWLALGGYAIYDASTRDHSSAAFALPVLFFAFLVLGYQTGMLFVEPYLLKKHGYNNDDSSHDR